MLEDKVAIIFDLDNTLIVEDNATQKAFQATCECFPELSDVDPKELFQSVCQHGKEIWHEFYLFDYCDDIQITATEALCADFLGDDTRLKKLHQWGPTYRRETWYHALLDHHIDDISLAEKLGEKYKTERRKRFYPFPEVKNTLEKLTQNYRLGMLTNGAPDLQREKIHKAGLDNYFEVITVSGEVGVGKPSPEIFSDVLDRMSISPMDAVMVGDNLERDILGANKAGMTSVWINHQSSTQAEDIKYDYEINRITDLIDLFDIED